MTRKRNLAVIVYLYLALATSAYSALIFPTDSTWRYFKGFTEASTPVSAWRANGFDDSAWAVGPAPFYYGEPLSGTQLLDMQGGYICLFMRKTFVLTNVAEIGGLNLGAAVDDGFVAWINGVEVARTNMSAGEPTTNSTAAGAATEPVSLQTFRLPAPAGYLVLGTNVIAVQAFNVNLSASSDFVFYGSLTSLAPDFVVPAIASYSPASGQIGSLTQITVTFTEPVVGVDADDLRINNQPANTMNVSGNSYTFNFSQPIYGPIAVTWASPHNIEDYATPPNAFNAGTPGHTWQYDLVDLVAPTVEINPLPGLVVRSLTQVEARFSEPVTGVDAADLRINNTPASSLIALNTQQYVFQFPQPATGTVQLAWAGAHGITDLAATPNNFVGPDWSYVLDPDAPLPNLAITEFLASNVSSNGLADETREQEAWIEIQNRGATAVNLAGWVLSDDADLDEYWVFPARIIQPEEFMVVWASGKDVRYESATNRFHTNFKLSWAGEHLGLYTPDSPRVLASGFSPEYPEQANDISYGYDPQGSLRYFAAPTPGASNGVSTIIGVCEPVHFSVERGYFTTPFTVYLSTDTPGATIRYTTNGSVPTATSGTLYTNGLSVASTRLLRAAAFKNNYLPSRTATHTYFFGLTAALRSLPILSVVTDPKNLWGPTGIIGINGGSYATGPWVANPGATNDYHNPSKHGTAWERPTSVEYILPGEEGGFQVDCGIRVQGSDWQRPRTTTTTKFSYRLYFRGDYGEGRLKYPIFPDSPVSERDQLVLRAGYNDNNNPFIRDELARQLSDDMGQVASHGGFTLLFTNGTYAGYYNPCERVHEELLQSYLGGSDEWDVIAPSFATGSGENGVVDGTRASFVSLVGYVNGQNVANSSIYQEVGRRLDLVNFVDYLLLNVYAGMGDWPQNNWRAGRDTTPGSRYRFIIWDGEWGFGINANRPPTTNTFAASGPGPDASGLASTADSEIAQMYQRLRLNPEFLLLWADRIQKHLFNGGALAVTSITNRFYEMRVQLSSLITIDNTGTAPPSIPVWAAQRRTNVLSHFPLYGLDAYTNAPAFNQHGGRVARGFNLTMTTAAGTVYYTTNGTDPRVPFTGAIAPDAFAYTIGQPVPLFDSAQVKARALAGGNWSALTEAAFQVGALGVPLRITEIMYNPPGGNAYEYLELRNVSGAQVDLSLMSFDGIDLAFAPNTYLAAGATAVLASSVNPAEFAVRYPGVTVFARYGGALDNGGELLVLKDANGQIVLSVDYNDANGWPKPPDGGGYSLELNDAFGNPDDPANWRASAAVGGTPGTQPVPPAPGDLRLNEVMATNGIAVANGATHPDYIELHNAGGSGVDLTGWSLSDDGDLPRKFLLPATNLPAGGFLVIWCDSATNTTPGPHAGFQLDNDGETVFLYNAASNLVDALTFGLQIADYPVGRVDGSWQLNTPTPGAANVAATLGSATNLAINEWLANPSAPQGGIDWLELFNRSTSLPVALRGIYLGTSNTVYQLTALSFIAPAGFVQLFADEQTGADHLDFKLSASANAIVLYDDSAVELQRVTYTAQTEGVSRGRLPDASATLANFPGSLSPGASNFVFTYTGPYLNEIMARNRAAVTNGAGQVADWIEFFNPNPTNVNLGGMSLSVDEMEPGQWIIPASTIIPPFGFLTIWCDGGRAASTNLETYLNLGRSLDGDSGGAYLFNAAGQLVNVIEYGFQVEDQSLGRIATTWRLLASATPGATNAAAATLGAVTALRLNEWMANPASGDDWFELYNVTNRPVDLSGLLLTDDPAFTGFAEFRVPALSFIGGNRWVKFVADGQPDAGRNHVSFDLAAQGEALVLYGATSNILHTAFFGAQPAGVSQGLLPDGGSNVVSFAGSPSPGESNYLPPQNAVINEALTHADAPLEDAVELHNPTAAPAPIGGWFLSDSQDNFKKYRIADGTAIPAGGFAVFYQNQFDGGATAFALNSARGGELWLSAADAGGTLTGLRAKASFGAAANGVSFGRFATRVGVDFTALSARTFGVDSPPTLAAFRLGLGATNAYPLVGPVVIHEIMYHPPDQTNGVDLVDNTADEFIELRNITAGGVPLFDPAHTTNTWRLGGGVEFVFPQGVTLAAGSNALVVSFDPVTNAPALAAFLGKYSVPPGVPIYGPYGGKLDNGGESIELYKPDPPQISGPDAGFVPQVLVDLVNYSDNPPWPSGAVDGGGLSLQRRAAASYGNDPENWVADVPTPGAANGGGVVTPPVITLSPQSQTNNAYTAASLGVTASGTGPLAYQWRFNGVALPGETNATLTFDNLQVEHQGTYDVYVCNAGGSVFSAAAFLRVNAPPLILLAPASQIVAGGANVTFTVIASGTAPLYYFWRFNGTDIAGATNTMLVLSNLTLANNGAYTVIVSNFVGVASTNATLNVLVRPSIAQHPAPTNQTVAVGGTATLTLSVSNNATLPITYRWRRGTGPPPSGSYLVDITTNSYTCILTLPNIQAASAGYWACVPTNQAGGMLPYTGQPAAGMSFAGVITVITPVSIAVQPTNQMTNAGEIVTFVASAAGATPIGYQWWFNGTNRLAGATNATLSLTNVQLSNDGAYTVVATNVASAATSQVAYLTILVPPAIVTQPTNRTTTVCSNAAFYVEATGGGPLRYQWFFNETNALSGATNSSLLIPAPGPADAGAYSVEVSNILNAVTSQVATLTLMLGDCDGDGMPDEWELANGLNPRDGDDRNGDADNDGQRNWQEHMAGTNPQDAGSYLKIDQITAGGSATIWFNAVSNKTYTVQYNDTLPSLDWHKLGDVEAAPTNRPTASVYDPTPSNSRAYRLVTPKQ